MSAEEKLYTLKEVSLHNTNTDCWLIIDGKVYDVTKFLEEHPGGDDVLLTATGKDATDDFEDVGHSFSARELMAKYVIGNLNVSTLPQKYVYSPSDPKDNKNRSTEYLIKILQFAVPLAILALAVAARFWTKTEEPPVV